MDERKGKVVSEGIAIGNIYYFKRSKECIYKENISDVKGELKRYETAKDEAIENLGRLFNDLKQQVGEDDARIFEMHMLMLEDEDYNDSVKSSIQDKKMSAEKAVKTTEEFFVKTFEEMEDEYFSARAADISDISRQVISILSGNTDEIELGDDPVILVADDLTPSETVKMDKSKLLAFVTEKGSSNSHTAILARAMGIPALVKVDIDEKWDKNKAVLDGENGKLYVSPEKNIVDKYTTMQKREARNKEVLKKLIGKKNITKSGKEIQVYANIAEPHNIQNVISNDAGGIGLFRSEFLYLKRESLPTEEELFNAYKQVAVAMKGKRVIIRTIDIGADKTAKYLNIGEEENPALGYRGIRLCLDREDIFKTQLRAIYRASAFGNVAVMYPMIISVTEIKRAKIIAKKVENELNGEHMPFKKIQHGIMIETPAAALTSDILATEVDFFSIGTNDLSQYTLAIDRQNENVEKFFEYHHEAVLRLIKMVVNNAHNRNIWVGICGELASDFALTKKFIDMGVDELSVTPNQVLPLRDKIRSLR